MLVELGFFWFPDDPDSRLGVGWPVFTEGTASAFFQVDICRLIAQELLNIGWCCSAMSCMDGPAAFSGGWMMLMPLYCYCYGSRFSGCPILLVCVFRGSRVIRSLP